MAEDGTAFLSIAQLEGWVRTSTHVEEVTASFKKAVGMPPDEAKVRIEPIPQSADGFLTIARQCNALGLDAAAMSAERICKAYRDGTDTAKMKALLVEMNDRLVDQLSSRLCWMIEPNKTRLFTETNPFGQEVADRFPSAALDAEEAGKCLALDRNTACVFHCMRVMEVGLRSLAGALGIPYAPSWESHLTQINKQFARDWKDKEPEWKQKESFYTEAAADLAVVKNAWRNPVMHVRGLYDGERAAEVFSAVRSFMRHLATELSE